MYRYAILTQNISYDSPGLGESNKKRLEQIHNNNLIHRDLHSGNILMGVNGILGSIRIADLGLCRNVDISTDFIYGIIPYVAPEIFKDSSYSQASDVYSFGMLMWEFTSGHRPFFNKSHNQNLIPNIKEVKEQIYKLCWEKENEDQFIQAENLRKTSVQLKFLEEWEGNNYSDYHLEAIYTCRPLNSMISLFELMLIERKEPISEVEGYKSIQENFEI
ncbi:hypothetical protein Glove_326g64 [Diversispora epigaea]|uniref:Protein kinase domain-containing protein n=1 Tax=Diversispora epigaea TaxID=1348612 RepID=A0A397HLZ8_9GLOM|nr:hypothetical protein Glove_326g64 [Diversispora epigaea]